MTTPEAVEGMVRALELTMDCLTKGNQVCPECRDRTGRALAQWHTRKPLREDAGAIGIVDEVTPRLTPPEVRDILDALDAHLFPGRLPEKGGPQR